MSTRTLATRGWDECSDSYRNTNLNQRVCLGLLQSAATHWLLPSTIYEFITTTQECYGACMHFSYINRAQNICTAEGKIRRLQNCRQYMIWYCIMLVWICIRLKNTSITLVKKTDQPPPAFDDIMIWFCIKLVWICTRRKITSITLVKKADQPPPAFDGIMIWSCITLVWICTRLKITLVKKLISRDLHNSR